MSDVIVSTTESVTDVTTTNDVTTISITDTSVDVAQSTAGFQGAPYAKGESIYVVVTNKTGSTLSKGSIVYTSGANGTHTQVSKAIATSDATSARTLGWVYDDIANNADGYVVVEGYLEGINTQGITEGAQLYLSGTTAGGFTQTKPQAPIHLVYVGVCAKASAGNGKVYVKVQNGYELDELHDVKIVAPANNDLLRYVSGTALWENVAASAVTVGSAITAGTASYATLAGTSTTISGSITKSQVSDFTSGTVTSASTAQQAGTATYASVAGSVVNSGTANYAEQAGTAQYAVLAGTASYSTTAGTLSGSITRSQVSDFTSGTVAVATNASTATYAVTAGTSVGLSGSITRSQVSDFTSGTVAVATNASTAITISGSITKSQVSDFTSGTVTSASTAQQAGTAVYATTSGTAVSISGSITKSQVSDFTSGTVASASTAQQAGTAVYASTAGTSTYATNAGTSVYATNAGTSVYATTSGTSVSISGTITASQVSDLANATVTNISGTVTQAQVSNLNSSLTIASSNGATTPLTVRGASPSQTVNLQSWQNNGLISLASVDQNGYGNFARVTAGQNSDLGYAVLSVNTGATATKGIVVQGVASQAVNGFEYQVSGGTVRAFINQLGRMGVRTSALQNGNESISVGSINPTDIGILIRGAASQSANLTEWQTSSGGTVTRITASGSLLFPNSGSSINGDSGNATLITNSTAVIPLAVRGASGQSANLQEWQNSGSTALASVSSAGVFSLPQASITNTIGTASVPLTVKGILNQSGSLQQWVNSGNSLLAAVDSGGNLIGTSLQSLNTYFVAGEVSGGGTLRMSKSTAVSTPAANYIRLQILAGTNANTFKLIAVAPSGTTYTIVDNMA